MWGVCNAQSSNTGGYRLLLLLIFASRDATSRRDWEKWPLYESLDDIMDKILLD